MRFFDRLRQAILDSGTNLCVGIDPNLEVTPSFVQRELRQAGVEQVLLKIGTILLDSAREYTRVVKFQSAFFEAAGLEGLSALSKLIKYAKARNFLCILDAKRSDIDSTMRSYGRASFEFLNADAMTVTPYMGLDVLDALVHPWLEADRGVYLVWYSSNSGGDLIQTETYNKTLLAFFNFVESHRLTGSCGLVVGATRVNQLPDRVLTSLEKCPLLVPGVGAQGGEIDSRFRKVLSNNRCSVVSVSRGISNWSSDNLRSWDQVALSFEENIRRYASSLKFVS